MFRAIQEQGNAGNFVSRRRLLALIGGAAGTAILAACGDEATSAPTATTARATTTTAAGSAVPTGSGSAASAMAGTTAQGSPVATTAAGTAAPSAVTGTTAPAGVASVVVGATPTRAATAAGSAVVGTTAPTAATGTGTRTASAVVGAGASTGAMASAGMLPTLDIESFDYGYRTVGTVPAGMTLVRQRNTGNEGHHVQFIRLRDGVTPLQVGAAFMGSNAEAAIAMLTLNVGGPGAVGPGGTSEAIINLQAGTHFLVCYIPSPDGTPHLAKGMVLPLQVTAAPMIALAPRLPETVGTVVMNDFSFQLPASTVPPGRSYWNVTNEGVQPHEFIVARLQPGKTPADITRFFAGPPMGPPPYTPVGGMQGLERGMSGIAVLDLPAGEYAAVCNIPDPMTRKAHLLLGMIAGLTVR